MKKSKIIIPALALIAFSTAASITGTVAWFTSSRTADFTAGSYEVVSTTVGLKYRITAGIGTAVDAEADNNNVSVASGNKLSDGSFDHVNSKIFTPNTDGTGLADNNGIALASANPTNMLRGNNVYTAFTWSITFSLEFKETGNDMALYLDNTAGHSAFSTAADFDAQTGFRMAFVGSGSAATRVWADMQTAAKSTHVNGTSTSTADSTFDSGISYVSPALIDSAYNTALPADSTTTGITASAAAARADYLGTFAFSANTTQTLTYTVVCWYEGTDENVVTGSTLGAVSASLYFEAVTLKPGA